MFRGQAEVDLSCPFSLLSTRTLPLVHRKFEGESPLSWSRLFGIRFLPFPFESMQLFELTTDRPTVGRSEMDERYILFCATAAANEADLNVEQAATYNSRRGAPTLPCHPYNKQILSAA